LRREILIQFNTKYYNTFTETNEQNLLFDTVHC